jgi:hypothetical protein
MRLDELVALPAYGSPLTGGIVIVLGATLMAAATAALWVHGGGLPMSPYPPARFVSSWVYRYLSNPMYVGAVTVFVGLALALRSAAGLWIVSPVLAASAVAWVLGYERDATREHFGAAVRVPLLHLPPASRASPDSWDRWSVYALVFVPWIVLYEAVELLGVPPDAVIAWQRWDYALPVLPWMEPLYFLVYPFVLAVPLVAATRADLRWFVTRGWVAMALIIPLYLLVPIVAPAKPVEGDGVLQIMLRWERAYDEPVTAFPAFHVVWVFLAALVYSRRWTRLAWAWWLSATAASVSCVAVGMHAAVDVVAGGIAFVIIVNVERIWRWIRHGTESLANSWWEASLGPVRVINHGVYAAIGAWLGTLVAVTLAGPENLWPVIVMAAAAVVGAGMWAQLVEGSPQLLRPYGYFGSVGGALVGLVLIGAFGGDPWRLSAAFAVGAALTQAIGRARCLVQGCCHGRECVEWLGIKYSHPRSRVTRLSPFGGRPLHPTQLYSTGWMLLVAAILARLWILGSGLQFISGVYLILTGLGRFVEEHYRGEPQTKVWAGLRVYQWLAIGFVVVGACVTTMGWRPAPGFAPPTPEVILATAGLGIAVYVAYGVDFPRLNRRFSRLA